ncbi:MAG: FliI/YscN family ATPase [Chlamydiales bacterium]
MWLREEIEKVETWSGPRLSGKVTKLIGLLIESTGPDVYVGEICHIYGKSPQPVLCQVVGFKEHKVLLMPLSDTKDITPGSEVFPTDEVHRVAVSPKLQGRILDAMGHPIDGQEDFVPEAFYPVSATPPAPLSRKPIDTLFPTKIKAIDALLTLGQGQRIGIFSAPGVGKSSLIGAIAKQSEADINVIALIGERGREVREFIERELEPEGLARSVVVAATSDQPALLRRKGANVAVAIAEYFRDQGRNVLFMMDSISRYAMALREIGLAIGEPPTSRGYPPSVFADLPHILERAGNSEKGSITGIYTILHEEEELGDPIPEQMRSLLDGHLHLSRSLAAANHFPPIDILKSLSRLMRVLVSKEQMNAAGKVRSLLQTYAQASDLINIGAYVKGSNPKIDEALAKIDTIHSFLQQEPGVRVASQKAVEMLLRLVEV